MMKLLLLEDDKEKRDRVAAIINSAIQPISVTNVDNFVDYLRCITIEKYDLIIVDLVVPQYKLDTEQVMTKQIVEVTRGDYQCINFRTPVIALTAFDAEAEDGFKALNLNDITVLNYNSDSNEWASGVLNKVLSCVPRVNFDVVIICALSKEAEAFAAAGFAVSEIKLINGLTCREIQIGARTGVVITAPRMGLVSAAVTCTQAIEFFRPKLVCMSGICAGVIGRSKIYDVIISETCHQNDSGKWAEGQFQPEIYSVPMEHKLSRQIDIVISRPEFLANVRRDVTLSLEEFPPGATNLDFRVILAPTSSGSAVIADDDKVDMIGRQQRKLHAFEMEAFAIYEAARLSLLQPRVFSAKGVVDDGSPSKGDAYHRVACLLSAKVIFECIASGMLD